MTEDWLHQRVDELFVEAIGQPAGDRASFVETAAKDDPAEVRDMVMQLIAADERIDTKFAGRGPLNLKDFTADEIADPRLGQQIDDYVIESRIASGGFGTVYLATRSEPYQETVAIKLLHRNSFATSAVVQRVLREMQALSDLRHPNIVTQLRSHVTTDGEPYIVMEYIDGLPLDEYCNKNQLSIDDRLKLFQNVCRAVEFAHSQGWVHRDLKPSNILVTAEGVPKLLDFGIAKLTVSPTSSNQQLQTITQGPVGTPHYMSPEQFAGKPVGPATDIYALGAILYELLSGHRAFDVMCRGIDTVVVEAVQTAVRERMPQRPSTLVMANDETASGISKEIVADQRAASPSSLRRCLRGDVDNIAMYALRKEPTRRYESAAAVAEDIQRWLDHRPVLARPDSMGYRAKKFVRRNRSAIGVGAIVFVCVLCALAASRRGRRAIVDRDVERAQKFMESADSSLAAGRIPEGMLRLHTAFDAAPEQSPYRESAARLISGWSRYLGQPLADRPNLRYVFSKNGKWIAVADRSGKVAIWNAISMRPIGELNAAGKVKHITLFLDSARFITVTENGLAELWGIEPSSMIRRQNAQSFDKNVLSITERNGKALLLTQSEGSVRLFEWDLDCFGVKQVGERKLSGEVVSANFGGNQFVVAIKKTAGQNNGRRRIEVWDGSTLQKTTELVTSCSSVGRFVSSPNQRFAAQVYRQGDQQRSVVVDWQSGSQQDFEGRFLAINDDGRCILGRPQELCFGDVTTGEVLTERPMMSSVRHNAAFTSTEVIVGAFRSQPRHHFGVIFDPFAGPEERLFERDYELSFPMFGPSTHRHDRIEFGPNGRNVVYDNRSGDAACASRIPWLWSMKPFLRAEIPSLQHSKQTKAIAISADCLVELGADFVGCWDGNTWRQAVDKNVTFQCIAIAEKPSLALIGDANGMVHTFQLPSLSKVDCIPTYPNQSIRSIATFRNGQGIIVATLERVSIYSTDSFLNGAPPDHTIERNNATIDLVRGNENFIGVASGDSVRNYRIKNDSEIDRVTTLVNPDGQLIDFSIRPSQIRAVANHAGEMKISLDDRRSQPLGVSRDGAIAKLRPDGNVVAIGYIDGSIQFWDALTRHRLTKRMAAGSGAIRELAFTTDGTKLVSRTDKGDLRVWDSAFPTEATDRKMQQTVEVLSGVDVSASDGEHATLLQEEDWRATYADWLKHQRQ